MGNGTAARTKVDAPSERTVAERLDALREQLLAMRAEANVIKGLVAELIEDDALDVTSTQRAAGSASP